MTLEIRGVYDMWKDVDYASHPIRPWCVGEECYYCKSRATHKIAETTNDTWTHPLTAYVCCAHFFGNRTTCIPK